MNQEQSIETTQQQLKELSTLSKLPMIILHNHELMYANDVFESIVGDLDFDGPVPPIIHAKSEETSSKRDEMKITNKFGEVFWFDCTFNDIMCDHKKGTLFFLLDARPRKEYEQKTERLKSLQQIIIDISYYDIDNTSLSEFFQHVLSQALLITHKVSLGTILLLKDNLLIPAAYHGYSQEIEDFKLPIERSFLFSETNGTMDHTINIKDTKKYPSYVSLKTVYGESAYIRSSLSTPILIQGKLYGMINLDSIEPNVFDEDDVYALTFIKNAIELAVSNHLKYEEKSYLSYFDAMTSLHNRYFFEQNSELILKRAQRYHEEFHVVVIDIDDLKQVNDTYGHLYGDVLIKHVAKVLNENTRESDVLARFGGDEFIGIAFNATTNELDLKLTNLKQILAQSLIEHPMGKIAASISYGIASFPQDGNRMMELIAVADKRMYQQKAHTKTGSMHV